MNDAQLSALRSIASLMQDPDNFRGDPGECKTEILYEAARAAGLPVETLVVGADLAPGDLAVFTDYAGREIGCRVEKVAEGMAWVRVCGLSDQPPYRIGDRQVIDLHKVKKAF